MGALNVWHLLILLVIVGLVIGFRTSRGFMGVNRRKSDPKHAEPVYSAETTQGNEAEFIGNSLPVRYSKWALLIAGIVTLAVVLAKPEWFGG